MNIKEKLDIAVNCALDEMRQEVIESIRNPSATKTKQEIISSMETFVKENLKFKKDNFDRFSKVGRDGVDLNIEIGESDDAIVVNAVTAHVSLDEENGVERDSYTNENVTSSNLHSVKLGLAAFIKKWDIE